MHTTLCLQHSITNILHSLQSTLAQLEYIWSLHFKTSVTWRHASLYLANVSTQQSCSVQFITSAKDVMYFIPLVVLSGCQQDYEKKTNYWADFHETW